jgi:Asp-tRNA(Asn)/Glu-tRNA(Gln) amidotransferase A subunit family amidase
MDLGNLHLLSASDAARLIRDGTITSEELVKACLARIQEVDSQVCAWAFLDPEYALEQARTADQLRLSGNPIGPLHGVPVGVKDIFDTADMPTECGSVLWTGRMPSRDATTVALLRAAGAIVMGKTVTTEFAFFSPGKTRNPHNPEHTPGGSSSGSAAAVAAGMVPLALGTQTAGSVIRPAAFCGVIGFKPSHGVISRHGVLQLSRTLDHVGMFARSLDDIALLAEQLVNHDENDPDTRPRARIPFLETCREEPPLAPMFGFIKTPYWDRVEAESKEGFSELMEELGGQAEEVDLFPSAANAWDWHQTILGAELAVSLAREWDKGRDKLSQQLRAQIERGQELRAAEYLRARTYVEPVHESFIELFEQRYDAIITPAAPGAAPKGLASTGDPTFCSVWTLLGMPAISLPLMQSAGGLPIGVQLVGPRGGDARLLRTARWLTAKMVAS